jgi:hypothetical protein
MSAPSRLRNPNPHLGAYYGIVTSAFVSLVIMLAMFEQLGWRQPVLAETMIVGPLALSYFIWRTAEMKSNQAATGLLYVALLFVLIGELLSSYLTVATGFPA